MKAVVILSTLITYAGAQPSCDGFVEQTPCDNASGCYWDNIGVGCMPDAGTSAKCNSIDTSEVSAFCAGNGANGLVDDSANIDCQADPCVKADDAANCCKASSGTTSATCDSHTCSSGTNLGSGISCATAVTCDDATCCGSTACSIPALGWKLNEGNCIIGSETLAAGSSCTINEEKGYSKSGTGTYTCHATNGVLAATSDLAVTGCVADYRQSAGTNAADGVCTVCDATNTVAGKPIAAAFGASATVCECTNSFTGNDCTTGGASPAQATCAQITDGSAGGAFVCGAGFTIKGTPEAIDCGATPCLTNADVTQKTACCDAVADQATCAEVADGSAGGAFVCGAGFTIKGTPEAINCGATPCLTNADATQKAACCDVDAVDAPAPAPATSSSSPAPAPSSVNNTQPVNTAPSPATSSSSPPSPASAPAPAPSSVTTKAKAAAPSTDDDEEFVFDSSLSSAKRHGDEEAFVMVVAILLCSLIF